MSSRESDESDLTELVRDKIQSTLRKSAQIEKRERRHFQCESYTETGCRGMQNELVIEKEPKA